MEPKKTIFIIDDSNTNVVLLEAILSTKGFRTISALSIREAKPLLNKFKPDIILLDLLMPDISGFDFLEEIREEPVYKNIPVVVVSALTDDQSLNRTLELGAVEYIKKPVDIASLVDTVEDVLSKYAAA